MQDLSTTLTFSNLAALFGAMAVLALLPSTSVLIVAARSASAGFVQGLYVTAGIVVADIFYILLAIFGLALLTRTLGDSAFLIQYAGGLYLIWLGIGLWRSGRRGGSGGHVRPASGASSFASGVLLTLADQKAVMFYLGFLPAFLDLSRVTWVDAGLIVLVTIIAVGGVKLGYAWAAARVGTTIGTRGARAVTMAASLVMIAIGLYLIGAA